MPCFFVRDSRNQINKRREAEINKGPVLGLHIKAFLSLSLSFSGHGFEIRVEHQNTRTTNIPPPPFVFVFQESFAVCLCATSYTFDLNAASVIQSVTLRMNSCN